MKKFAFIFSAIGFFAAEAQIKVHPGGNLAFGFTNQTPLNGFKMQLAGNSVFSASTSAITSAAFIRGNNAYSEANMANSKGPDYTWVNDDITGIFHPALYTMAFSSNGSEKMRLMPYTLHIGGTSDNQGKLAITADNTYVMQGFHTVNFDGAFASVQNVNRDATKAWILFNTSTGSQVLKYYVGGDGAVWCKQVTTWSDLAFKENIDSLKGALGKVRHLQAYYYNIKPDQQAATIPSKEIGLIAQDVEQVVPEVVVTNLEGKKGINYGNLSALLIEAIKEQDRKISSLEAALTACCSSGNRTINNGSGMNESQKGEHTAATQIKGAYLGQNNPNPFNQTTMIKCFVPEQSKAAMLLVFDMNGTLKKSIPVNGKGETSVIIQAKEFIAGMYHYSLIIDGQEIDTKKMILTE